MVTALTEYEMKLVIDGELLLSKNKVIQKVCALFGGLNVLYQEIVISENLSRENFNAPKISKGENYNGLPYVILDYPRQFGKVDVFAVRTFFWWGNFFSITLQLGGQYKDNYLQKIKNAIETNLLESWYISRSKDPWQHHFESDNYELLQPGKEYDVDNQAYLKMAKKIPLNQWDDVEAFFEENFTFIIKILAS
jgi:hypothetical protein